MLCDLHNTVGDIVRGTDRAHRLVCCWCAFACRRPAARRRTEPVARPGSRYQDRPRRPGSWHGPNHSSDNLYIHFLESIRCAPSGRWGRPADLL